MGYTTSCWVWLRSCRGAERKYGHLMIDGRLVAAHRHFYEARNGVTVDPSLDMDHLCRVGLCVNPDHVEPVTRAVNVQRGATARLTGEQVLEARARWEDGERTADLALELGVGLSTVEHAIAGRHWKEIEAA